MKRFWCSWHQPTADFRPLRDPPNDAVLGWWCSGERGDGVAILCALVRANSAGEVERAIEGDWPEATEWRFVEERTANWLPGDRFPLRDWMLQRISEMRKAARKRGKTI